MYNKKQDRKFKCLWRAMKAVVDMRLLQALLKLNQPTIQDISIYREVPATRGYAIFRGLFSLSKLLVSKSIKLRAAAFKAISCSSLYEYRLRQSSPSMGDLAIPIANRLPCPFPEKLRKDSVKFAKRFGDLMSFTMQRDAMQCIRSHNQHKVAAKRQLYLSISKVEERINIPGKIDVIKKLLQRHGPFVQTLTKLFSILNLFHQQNKVKYFRHWSSRIKVRRGSRQLVPLLEIPIPTSPVDAMTQAQLDEEMQLPYPDTIHDYIDDMIVCANEDEHVRAVYTPTQWSARHRQQGIHTERAQNRHFTFGRDSMQSDLRHQSGEYSRLVNELGNTSPIKTHTDRVQRFASTIGITNLHQRASISSIQTQPDRGERFASTLGFTNLETPLESTRSTRTLRNRADRFQINVGIKHRAERWTETMNTMKNSPYDSPLQSPPDQPLRPQNGTVNRHRRINSEDYNQLGLKVQNRGILPDTIINELSPSPSPRTTTLNTGRYLPRSHKSWNAPRAS